MQLATLGKERVDEAFDSEIAVNREIDYYRNKGYSDKWISERLNGILNRKKLRYREDILDNINEDELVDNLFRINQTKQKLLKDNV